MAGFDIEGEGAAVKDVAAAGIWDLYMAKWWGLKLATGAVNTVLRVDQVSYAYCISYLQHYTTIVCTIVLTYSFCLTSSTLHV